MQHDALSFTCSSSRGSTSSQRAENADVIVPVDKKRRYRIALKLLAAFVLLLVLMLFSRSKVDFVYTGF